MAAAMGKGWCAAALLFLCCWSLILRAQSLSEERLLGSGGGGGDSAKSEREHEELLLGKLVRSDDSRSHPWPELELGWRVVLGSLIAFAGSALGSIGGVGGGGIFVPMLSLIIGFDIKTSAAISKCMIMGAAAATVCYNLRFRHPTLDMPIIDYDLALLFQPMLMLGISIGVNLNVIFAEWMITAILVILFLGTSVKACLKGVDAWRKETVLFKEAERGMCSSTKLKDVPELEYQPLPGEPLANDQSKCSSIGESLSAVPMGDNIYVKELMLLLIAWLIFLIIHIIKTHLTICSTDYWILALTQVPVAVALALYEAISLYRGKRAIASTGKQDMNWRVQRLVLYCCCGLLAGIVGGLLGLGGGFILGPLFLEMGVPPQVASATSNFIMTFSSSMSVVQYYLLDRVPVPYSAYLFCVATLAAIVGQHAVRKLIIMIGRASLVIFVLALTIFVSAIGIGLLGTSDALEKIGRKEYMGFANLCNQF